MRLNDEEKLKNTIRFLKPGNEKNLLKLISSKVTEEMLVDIASTDMGWKFEENLAMLRRITKKYKIPARADLDYEKLRVFIFENVHEDQDKNKEYNQHLIRAFCCAIHIPAMSIDDDGWYSRSEYFLIQLIESCNYLGKDFLIGVIELLVWQITEVDIDIYHTEENFLNITYLFALVYLLLKTDYSVAEADLKNIVDYLNTIQPGDYQRNWWVFYNFEHTNHKWKKLTEELSTLTIKLKDDELKTGLQKISDTILLKK